MVVLGADSEANLDLALLVIPSVSWGGYLLLVNLSFLMHRHDSLYFLCVISTE